MSQVRLLSVDVGQNPDIQSGKGEASIKDQANASAFSDAMEQHYPRKTVVESYNRTQQGGNASSKAATSASKSDDVSKQAGNDKPDEDTLPVPISQDEQALNAKRSQEENDQPATSVPVASEGEQDASLDSAKADITAELVSPLTTENKAEVNLPSSEQKLYLNVTGQAGNDTTSNIESDDAVDLLKMLNGAQQLLTKSATEKINMEQSSKVLTTEQDVLAKVVNGERVQLLSTASDGQQAQLLAENALTSDVKKMTSMAESTTSLTIEQGVDSDIALLTQKLAAEALKQESTLTEGKDTKQAAASSEMQNIAASDLDLALAKKAAAAELSAELSTEAKAIVGESDDSQGLIAETKQLNLAELKRVGDNEKASTNTVNQSTASVIAASSTDKKVASNQQVVTNEDTEQAVSSDVDAENLTEKNSEKQTLQTDKIASVFNQTLDAQAATPNKSSAEVAAQQAQSFESAINQLTTNTVQTQKSITALSTETIAIYRKDFADAVKDKVMVMINQKIQQVEIQLDPPEMGNIHVRVNLQNEQAAVQFVVQNQQAKEALEQNMAKLRDMLAENGVDVGDANIEQRQAKEQNGNGFDSKTHDGQSNTSGEDISNENESAVANVMKVSSTGVDYYA